LIIGFFGIRGVVVMKFLVRIGVLFLIVLFLSVGISLGQNTAKQHLTIGVKYAAHGKFREAKKEFEKALKVNPYDTTAYEGLKLIGDVNQQKINTDTAIHFFKGVAYSLKRESAEAIGEFSKAIEKNPKFAPAYNNRGKDYRWKDQYEQAISDHSKAIEINPRYAKAYLSRGITYTIKGQYDKATSDCTRAIEINPRLPNAYNIRGLAYNMRGQYGKSISDYTKAIEINPRYANAYYNRGVAYFYKREYEKAWDDIHKAQDLGYPVHQGFLKDLREASGRKR